MITITVKSKTIPEVVVVYNPKSLEIVPFVYGDKGEIIITSTDPRHNHDNLFVKKVKITDIDIDRGVLIRG